MRFLRCKHDQSEQDMRSRGNHDAGCDCHANPAYADKRTVYASGV
jgi:hypothetical protein